LELRIGLGRGQGADLIADGRINGGDGGDAMEQGAQIKPGAAYEDGGEACGVGLGDFCAGAGRPIGGGAGLRAIPCAIEAMGHLRGFRWRGGGGEDGQVGVELCAVGVDDYRAAAGVFQRAGEGQGKIALAAGGWPCDEADRLAGDCSAG